MYAVLANKIITCIYLCSSVFMSRFGTDLNPMTVNISGYQMRLLVWRVGRDGSLEKLWLMGWRGGEFSSRRNFFSLSNSLYEFFLGHSMNIS